MKQVEYHCGTGYTGKLVSRWMRELSRINLPVIRGSLREQREERLHETHTPKSLITVHGCLMTHFFIRHLSVHPSLPKNFETAFIFSFLILWHIFCVYYMFLNARAILTFVGVDEYSVWYLFRTLIVLCCCCQVAAACVPPFVGASDVSQTNF